MTHSSKIIEKKKQAKKESREIANRKYIALMADKTDRLAEFKFLCKQMTNEEVSTILGVKVSSVRVYKAQNPEHPYYFKAPTREKLDAMKAYLASKEAK